VRKSLLSSSILLLSPLTAYALGLGDIKVNSSLNEPLDARIELKSASFRDMESLIVKMASTQDYLKADVEKSDTIRSVRFKVKEDANGQSYIQVYTKKILREPFIDLLVDVSWGAGRLLREYTILLDPPEIAKVKPKAIVKPVVPKLAPISKEVKKVVATAEIAPSQGNQNSIVSETAIAESDTGEIVSARTLDSDTLWSIAYKMRPDSSISMEQMMLAILRENPRAFNRGNINGLMGGFVLRITEPSKIVEISKLQAKQEVAEQNKVWNDIRQKAGYPITTIVQTEDKVNQQVQKGETPKAVVEADDKDVTSSKTIESDSQAQLELLTSEKVEEKVKSAAESSKEQDLSDKLAAQLALTEELMESQIQENEELKARIRELERLLNKKESLVELKDENLAILQQKQQQEMTQEQVIAEQEMLETPVMTENAEQISEGMATESMESDTAEPEVTPDAMAQESMQASSDTVLDLEEHIDDISLGDENSQAEAIREQEEAEPVSEVEVDQKSSELAPSQQELTQSALDTQKVEETQTTQEEIKKIEPKKEVVKATPKPKKVMPKEVPAKVKKPEPDLLTNIMNNYLVEAGAAGGVLLLLLILLVLRKSKGKKEDDFQESILNAQSSDGAIADQIEPIESAEESTGLEDETTFLSDFSSSELDSLQPDDTESDPLSEADVFIVYGRYGQAEELLKGVINAAPERLDYQMKLLEVYHGDKQKQAFKQQAETIKGLIEGSGEDLSLSSDWEKVQKMASALDINLSFLESTTRNQLNDIAESIGEEDDDDEFDLDSIDVDELERQLMASEAMLNDDFSFDDIDGEMQDSAQEDELGIDKIASADDSLLNENTSADTFSSENADSFELDLDEIGADVADVSEDRSNVEETVSLVDEIPGNDTLVEDAENDQSMDIDLDDLELDELPEVNNELSLDDAVAELSLEDELKEQSSELSHADSELVQEELSDESKSRLEDVVSNLSLDDEFSADEAEDDSNLELDLDELGDDIAEPVQEIDSSLTVEVSSETETLGELDLDALDNALDNNLELDLDDLSLDEDSSEQSPEIDLEPKSEALQKMVSEEIGGTTEDLELDLDELEPQGESYQSSESQEEIQSSGLELDIDDLSLDEPDQESAEPQAELGSEVEEQETIPSADDLELDLDSLSLDEADTEQAAEKPEIDTTDADLKEATTDDFELDLDDLSVDDVGSSESNDDISLADELDQVANQEDHIEDIDLDSLSLDENTDVLNAGLEDLANSENKSEPDLDGLDADLNEFAELEEQDGDIDLAEIEAELSKIMEDEPEVEGSDLDNLSLDDLELIPDEDITELDSVGNKLDLAKAYIEKGDKDAAIELLSVVMDTGDDEQKQQAKKLFELAK